MLLHPAPAAFTTPERASAPSSPSASRPVQARVGATTDAAVVRVAECSAVKHNTFPSRPGYPSGAAHWQTHLHVEAWVRNTTYVKHLWADVHAFAHDGALVSSQTCGLAYERPAGDGGDLFRLDCVAYEGTTATPGSTSPRPDVRLVQFRLYAELDGRVLTDGVLHACVLKPDVASR